MPQAAGRVHAAPPSRRQISRASPIMRAPSGRPPFGVGPRFEGDSFESEEIPMIRLLRRTYSPSTRCARRPARRGGFALALLIAVAFISACETVEEAPPPPPAEEVFESPEPSAPIQEESLGPPPAPTPPPGAPSVAPPAGGRAMPPAVIPSPETTIPPAVDEGTMGRQRRFPLSSPGSAPPGAAPIQPAPSE